MFLAFQAGHSWATRSSAPDSTVVLYMKYSCYNCSNIEIKMMIIRMIDCPNCSGCMAAGCHQHASHDNFEELECVPKRMRNESMHEEMSMF